MLCSKGMALSHLHFKKVTLAHCEVQIAVFDMGPVQPRGCCYDKERKMMVT